MEYGIVIPFKKKKSGINDGIQNKGSSSGDVVFSMGCMMRYIEWILMGQ